MPEELLKECPFCGEEISIFIGNKCGSEPDGCIVIYHTCPSGLTIEWQENGDSNDNKQNAIEAWNCRQK